MLMCRFDSTKRLRVPQTTLTEWQLSRDAPSGGEFEDNRELMSIRNVAGNPHFKSATQYGNTSNRPRNLLLDMPNYAEPHTSDPPDSRNSPDRLSFLAQASKALSSSLEYEATLQQVTRLAVPFVSDWCGIDIVSPDGEIVRVASTHVDPNREAL